MALPHPGGFKPRHLPSLFLKTARHRLQKALPPPGREVEGGGAGEGRSSSGICATRRMLLLETQGKVSHKLCLRRRRGRHEGEQGWPTRALRLRLSNDGRDRFVQLY